MLRFLLISGILLAAFYLFVAFAPIYKRGFIPWYHHLIAKTCARLLTALGQDVTTLGTSISSSKFSVSIIQGCDAVEPIALFICAILAFPSPFLGKIPGMIAGAVLLFLLNLARIVSLFLLGVYSPELFAVVHIDVWQALFVFFAVLFWILWLLWIVRMQVIRRPAPN
jgi:exosortase H (IPTLxxWG-CTERM-specific)